MILADTGMLVPTIPCRAPQTAPFSFFPEIVRSVMITSMGTNAIHMSEAELARDIHSLVNLVRAGAEVVVERDSQPIAVLRSLDSAVEPGNRELLESASELLKQSPAEARDDSGQLATSPTFLGFWMLPRKS
jgi:antitoxin (DNA-binding transcriptional repressor) of toxin-antitoxin stability system